MKLAYKKPEVTLEQYTVVDVVSTSINLEDIIPDLPVNNGETDLDNDDLYDPK